MKAIWIALLGVALLAGSAAGASTSTTVDLVAYSTPKDAYGKIISAFQGTAAGNGVSFNQSYGASGDQARAVAAGLPADVVNLSLDPDVDLLVRKGLVPKNWKANSHKGIVSDSIVVFVVRDGNPKHVKGWGDLIKPDVKVITPNPFTSGGARWNVMAAYGAQRRKGKSHAQAVKYLDTLFHHVSVQDKSAREALQTFLGGKGDVLLTYENEAKLALAKGQPAYFVIPKATIRIENPVAVLKNSKNLATAKAFVKFLYTPTAQRLFGQAGYRPVVKSALKDFNFPVRPWLFTIGYVGGWAKVQKQFFDPDTGVMAKIEKGLG